MLRFDSPRPIKYLNPHITVRVFSFVADWPLASDQARCPAIGTGPSLSMVNDLINTQLTRLESALPPWRAIDFLGLNGLRLATVLGRLNQKLVFSQAFD